VSHAEEVSGAWCQDFLLWTAAARRRLCHRPWHDFKAASSRRSPRCSARFLCPTPLCQRILRRA
jgi:hypothetical protein